MLEVLLFGIGSTELAIILVFGFLLFGPDKLPQMGRTIGRALRQFRETQEKLTNVVQTEVVDPMTAAATAPTKSRKSTVDDDDDADIEDEVEAPAHKETFAERRARLAAEKAAAEAQGAEAAEAGEDAGDASAATDEQPAESAASAEAVASEPEPSAEDEEAAEVKATADLYARRPRKRKAAADPTAADQTEAPADEPASAEEGGEQ